MPTLYKAQLDHKGFDWSKQPDVFDEEITLLKEKILESAGFYREFGRDLDESAESEKRQFLRELSGILCLAAAIESDAGFKATGKLIATLKAIKRNPYLIYSNNIEPEALGMLLQCYQRENEEPGKHCFDIDSPPDGRPSLENIRKAAEAAIALLTRQAARCRPSRVVVDMLAKRLRALFLRFNDTATRSSVVTSSKRNRLHQIEDGKFLKFLKLALSPLDRYLKNLPTSCEVKRISAAQVSRRGTELGNQKILPDSYSEMVNPVESVIGPKALLASRPQATPNLAHN